MDATLVMMLGLTITSMSEVPNFLAGLLPSLMTIGRFGADPEDRAKLRRGEVVGMGLALATGLGMTLILRGAGVKYWYLPLAGTAAVGAVLLFEYENGIREAERKSHAQPIDRQPEVLTSKMMPTPAQHQAIFNERTAPLVLEGALALV